MAIKYIVTRGYGNDSFVGTIPLVVVRGYKKMRVREQNLINALAVEFRQISGIKNAYNFAENPDTLSDAQLPAVLFVPTSFNSSLFAHHNHHKNEIVITATVFVTPRQSQGGKLKNIENAAMPFLGSIREKFQTEATINNLFAIGNLTKVYEFSGTYGAGGNFLTFNSVPYIGVVITFNFTEII